MLIEGIGEDWEDMIDSYAYHFANETGVPQVVWHNSTLDVFGRTPLPEWNLERYEQRVKIRVVKVIKPSKAVR